MIYREEFIKYNKLHFSIDQLNVLYDIKIATNLPFSHCFNIMHYYNTNYIFYTDKDLYFNIDKLIISNDTSNNIIAFELIHKYYTDNHG